LYRACRAFCPPCSSSWGSLAVLDDGRWIDDDDDDDDDDGVGGKGSILPCPAEMDM